MVGLTFQITYFKIILWKNNKIKKGSVRVVNLRICKCKLAQGSVIYTLINGRRSAPDMTDIRFESTVQLYNLLAHLYYLF